MQKLTFTTLLFLVAFITNGQKDNFEEGYYISSQGTKVNCLIKNEDWLKNPTEITVLAEGIDKILTIDQIEEFGIHDYSKYVKFTTKIDQSPTKTSKLSNSRNPDWETKTVLLKTLLEADLTLYEYFNNNSYKYFIESSNELEPLVFKKYQKKAGIVLINNYYQQQIKQYADCDEFDDRKLASIDYNSRDLIRVITVINQCKESAILNYHEMKSGTQKLFNLSITSGLSFSSLSLSPASGDDIEYDNENNIRIGVELEYILPYANGKWSIIADPHYQYYSSSAETKSTATGGVDKKTIDYRSIVLPIGLRRNFSFHDNFMFANLLYSFDFDFKSKVGIDDIEVEGRPALGIGIGIKKKKLSFETRYNLNREITGNHVFYSSDYRKMSLIFSYLIL
ncbi:hypothetical protein SAMN05421640_2518 [Ekhidna lutea]|uniref:Outer membrane protein beta-barrel domain-containing protein n=1 Tax=Ekhidna lutea TaxID=447679 RepID=A0A239K8Q3_EKHLU|nr:hypothetical protein [Ekhidna lutea]SNT14846.1 hypothetical protein SAMN05421640_2518 [Ekhidna lutea]